MPSFSNSAQEMAMQKMIQSFLLTPELLKRLEELLKIKELQIGGIAKTLKLSSTTLRKAVLMIEKAEKERMEIKLQDLKNNQPITIYKNSIEFLTNDYKYDSFTLGKIVKNNDLKLKTQHHPVDSSIKDKEYLINLKKELLLYPKNSQALLLSFRIDNFGSKSSGNYWT